MKVSIVGTGYVGLVTGACLAEKGHTVICVDVDPEKVTALNRGRSPFFEPGLEELLAVHAGRGLRATADLAAAVRDTDLTMIAVGTPFHGDAIDLTAVLGAAEQIGRALHEKNAYHVVVVKSTVVPGTTEREVLPVLEAASGKQAGSGFGLGMNPEFLSEGEAVSDFLRPDRIVLGGIDERSIAVLEDLYAPFPPEVPRLSANPRTAEMIKYSSNALLAALISFTNELANVGAGLGGIDTVEVMRGVHLSQYFSGQTAEGLPRITSFLKAGCGFGGSCLPKDVRALIAHARNAGSDTPLLEAVMRINDSQPARVVDLLRKHWPDLTGRKVTVLGLAFKPDTSDVRESPAFPIIRLLLEAGAQVTAHDPVANHEARKVLGEAPVDYRDDMAQAVSDAEAVVVVTSWSQFAGLPHLLRGRQPEVLAVDCRRFFPKDAFARYEGIGR